MLIVVLVVAGDRNCTIKLNGDDNNNNNELNSVVNSNRLSKHLQTRPLVTTGAV